VVSELTKTKTRYAILQEHMKSKDKFIDELLKSTQFMNSAILNGTDAQAIRDMVHQQVSSAIPKDTGNADSSAYRELMENGPYSILKLKKKCQDLKSLLQLKTIENEDLNKNLKHLKVVELQKEVNLYSRECNRLHDLLESVIVKAKSQNVEIDIEGML
jgi:hypothetical protein